MSGTDVAMLLRMRYTKSSTDIDMLLPGKEVEIFVKELGATWQFKECLCPVCGMEYLWNSTQSYLPIHRYTLPGTDLAYCARVGYLAMRLPRTPQY
eukprot:1488359-Rhodomonas_salina.1